MPDGSAVNTFSSPSPFDWDQVDFAHQVAANEDLSELRLNDGEFEIAAANGDVLLGTYHDFVYQLQADGSYVGAGDFLLNGGTGAFAGATGDGSWTAVANFTSSTGGTADHVWTGTLIVPAPEPEQSTN